MKNLISLSVLIFSIMILSACQDNAVTGSNEVGDPAYTAKAFTKALAEGDLAEAQKYAESKSKKALAEINDEKTKSRITEHFTDINIDTLILYATVEYTTSAGKKDKMQMEYRNGEWKAFLNAEFAAGSPLSVAKLFMKSLSDLDFEQAKKYGTENTNMLLTMVESLSSLATDFDDIPSGGDYERIVWGETEINGKRAKVYYSNGETEESVDLRLVGSEWKVDLKKE